MQNQSPNPQQTEYHQIFKTFHACFLLIKKQNDEVNNLHYDFSELRIRTTLVNQSSVIDSYFNYKNFVDFFPFKKINPIAFKLWLNHLTFYISIIVLLDEQERVNKQKYLMFDGQLRTWVTLYNKNMEKIKFMGMEKIKMRITNFMKTNFIDSVHKNTMIELILKQNDIYTNKQTNTITNYIKTLKPVQLFNKYCDKFDPIQRNTQLSSVLQQSSLDQSYYFSFLGNVWYRSLFFLSKKGFYNNETLLFHCLEIICDDNVCAEQQNQQIKFILKFLYYNILQIIEYNINYNVKDQSMNITHSRSNNWKSLMQQLLQKNNNENWIKFKMLQFTKYQNTESKNFLKFADEEFKNMFMSLKTNQQPYKPYHRTPVTPISLNYSVKRKYLDKMQSPINNNIDINEEKNTTELLFNIDSINKNVIKKKNEEFHSEMIYWDRVIPPLIHVFFFYLEYYMFCNNDYRHATRKSLFDASLWKLRSQHTKNKLFALFYMFIMF